MKVILVNGSPHEHGNTYTALNHVAETLNAEGIETHIYWIGNKPISGCVGCAGCLHAGKCVVSNDVNEFVELAKTADGFVFGTPVHYAAMTGALTSFLDRAFYSAMLSKNDMFSFKPAASVIVARRAGTTATFDQLNKYYGITQMPIISTRYWNMVHGAKPGEVEQDLEGMQSLAMLAKNMAYFLKCVEAGKAQGINKPEQEKIVFTNFIR